MEIVIICQARTTSSRLPNKVLMPILGKSVLFRQMERMLESKEANQVVIANTTNQEDDIISEIAINEGFECFRGHPEDLLDRHYKAGLKYKADVVIKIPSDCPLIDPNIIDKVIKYYKSNEEHFDFVSNLHPATYPDGNDVELIPMEILELAWKEAQKKHEREHTTPYIWDNPNIFNIGNVEWESGMDYSMSHRFTIDYQEDYDFINRVYEELYPQNRNFVLEDILQLLKDKPEIYNINKMYAGVNWYRNNLQDLKTVSHLQTKFTEKDKNES